MGLRIFWTDFAKNELHEIFSYYYHNAGVEIARTVVVGIENKTRILKTHPNLGQREDLLKDRPEEFRYLVFKNYKILYWHNKAKIRIEIIDVFDTRQNPIKILKNN